jgi:hypothetical protein
MLELTAGGFYFAARLEEDVVRYRHGALPGSGTCPIQTWRSAWQRDVSDTDMALCQAQGPVRTRHRAVAVAAADSS